MDFSIAVKSTTFTSIITHYVYVQLNQKTKIKNLIGAVVSQRLHRLIRFLSTRCRKMYVGSRAHTQEKQQSEYFERKLKRRKNNSNTLVYLIERQ